MEKTMCDKKKPIFLLHGLGSHTITFLPMELYLNSIGYENTYKLSYPVDDYDTVDGSVDYVDKEMEKYACKDKDEVILIGQSMGGVVANNIHKKGWKVLYAVYIGSPLHGARLLNQLEKIVPTNIRDALYKKPYGILQKCTRASEPDHDYNTISMGWFNTEFDGCVYKDEVVLNEDKHVHLCWADHRTIFANPRLWTLVGNLLTKKLNKI
jgi:hypothetical protein